MPKKNNRDKENIILPFFTTGRFGPLYTRSLFTIALGLFCLSSHKNFWKPDDANFFGIRTCFQNLIRTEISGNYPGFCNRDERPESTGSKILFSLSSVILFRKRGVDSCVFLIFTTRIGLKTRLNGVKSICFEQFRKF